MTLPRPHAELLASLQADRRHLHSVLTGADLTAPVPACPNWDLAELVVHVGRVNRWATAALSTPPGLVPPAFGPRPDRTTDLVAWLDAGLADLIAALSESDPNRPAWTFLDEPTVSFWIRRQALETAIHRVDVELALYQPIAPISQAVARTGIDEWCELQESGWFSTDSGLSLSVHLHATDTEGEWIVNVNDQGFAWSQGHAKGDLALRGPLMDLLLVLWRRGGLSQIDVFGDNADLDRFLNAIGG